MVSPNQRLAGIRKCTPGGVSGWTLPELIIVLGVLAILVAVAYPAYVSQAIKARRAEGHALLYGAAQAQQQYFANHRTFASAVVGSGAADRSQAWS